MIMRKYVLTSILGLGIVAGSLAVAAPAQATMWRNFGSTNSNAMYLNSVTSVSDSAHPIIRGTQGNAFVIHTSPAFPPQNFPSQLWSLRTTGTGFWRLIPQFQPSFPGNLVAGVAGGNVNNGTPLITWSANGNLDQDWLIGPAIFDGNGALCYVFFNRQNQSKVMGVSGNVMEENRPVIIWTYLADIVNHADQFWCAYTPNASGAIVPQNPPPL